MSRVSALLLLTIVIVTIVCVAGCGGFSTKLDGGTDPGPIPPDDKPFAPWTGVIALSVGGSSVSHGLWFLTPEKNSRKLDGLNAQSSPLIWSPDGNTLACIDNYRYTFLGKDGTVIGQLPDGLNVDLRYSWLPDSSGVCYGRYYKGLYFGSTSGSENLLINSSSATFDHNPVFSEDGRVFYLHHEYGGNCYIREISKDDLFAGKYTFRVIKMIDTTWNEKVILVPHNNHLIISYDSKIEVLDQTSGSVIANKDEIGANDIQLSPDKRLLAVINNSGSILILDPATLNTVYEIKQNLESSYRAIAWSPDSKALALAQHQNIDYIHYYNIVTIWRISDPRQEVIYKVESSYSVSSPTGYYDQGFSVGWTR